jgi:predicted site-specific integrase-resolvase
MAKSRYLARRWIKEGKIKAISDGFGKGRRVRVKGQWLLDFIAACEKGKF